MSELRAVLFDMDGTICDTEPAWMATERQLAADNNAEWTHDDALALLAIAEPGQGDFSSLGAEGEALSTQLLVDLQALVDAGPDAFTDESIGTLLGGAAGFIDALTMGECIPAGSS